MRLNFVIVYTKNGKNYAVEDCLTGVEYINLKYQFERMCKATMWLGKPTIIQCCPSYKSAIKLAEEWNQSYKNNGTYLDPKEWK